MKARSIFSALVRGMKYRDFDYFRLLNRAALRRRRGPGRIRLRFGRIDYLDILATFGQYEEIFLQKGYDFAASLDDPVIVDCGGNIGMSVLRFARLFPAARIQVYEADPRISEVLRANLKANHVEAEVIGAAVSVSEGEVRFNPDGSDGGSIVGASGLVRVPGVRLAERLPPRVDLLKLDIEGAEYAVIDDLCISGAIDRVRRIAGEFHCCFGLNGSVGRTMVALENAGFSVSIPFARPAPDLVGKRCTTPFARVADGKTIIHFCAWRPDRT